MHAVMCASFAEIQVEIASQTIEMRKISIFIVCEFFFHLLNGEVMKSLASAMLNQLFYDAKLHSRNIVESRQPDDMIDVKETFFPFKIIQIKS
jgi:hypothetical protein